VSPVRARASYWQRGSDQRVFVVRGEYLTRSAQSQGSSIPISARRRVNLKKNEPYAERFSWTAGPIVVGDVAVIAGNSSEAADFGLMKEA
jgi:hypothetical protein